MSYAGKLEDRIAIRELLDTYADAVFRQDEEAWSGCWAQDGVWSMIGEHHGRAAIVAAWRQAMAPFGLTAYYSFPGEIVVDGDEASARSHTREHLFLKDGGVRRMIGRYDDRLTRTKAGWRFLERRYTLLREESE